MMGEMMRKTKTGIQPLIRMDAEAGFGDGGAGIAADDGVRRTRRQRHEPGDDIPSDGADESAADDVDVHRFGIDQFFADGLGDSGAKDKGGDEVEKCRPEDGLQGRQNARGDDGGDGVCSVVEAVEEVEDEGDGDHGIDEIEHGHSGVSSVLQQHAGHGFARFFTALDGFFQQIVHLFFLDDIEWISICGEERAKELFAIAFDQLHGRRDRIQTGLHFLQLLFLPQATNDVVQFLGDGGEIFAPDR